MKYSWDPVDVHFLGKLDSIHIAFHGLRYIFNHETPRVEVFCMKIFGLCSYGGVLN